jgi:hypothetical protein
MIQVTSECGAAKSSRAATIFGCSSSTSFFSLLDQHVKHAHTVWKTGRQRIKNFCADSASPVPQNASALEIGALSVVSFFLRCHRITPYLGPGLTSPNRRI